MITHQDLSSLGLRGDGFLLRLDGFFFSTPWLPSVALSLFLPPNVFFSTPWKSHVLIPTPKCLFFYPLEKAISFFLPPGTAISFFKPPDVFFSTPWENPVVF